MRYFGKIANDGQALRKLAEKLSGQGRRLRFCYEAGPCGYGVYRTLTGLGHDCAVVAPSLIPRRPGDRVKTDRRDCLGLATLERAGELTAVWVPEPGHEALRDLVRASSDIVREIGRDESGTVAERNLILAWQNLQRQVEVHFGRRCISGSGPPT